MTIKRTTIKAIALASLLCMASLARADNNGDGTVTTQNGPSTTITTLNGTTTMPGGPATSVMVPSYSDPQLAQAGCDKAVWTQMVNDYQSKAQTQLAIGNQVAQLQMQGAPSPVSSCFDSAALLINNATRAYNTIVSLLTGGGLDSSMLYTYAQKLVVGAACSEINSMINQSGIGSSIGQANSQIGSALNTGTNIGGINTGSVSQILNGGGYQQNTSNNVPYTSGTGLANSTGAAGLLNSINPFK